MLSFLSGIRYEKIEKWNLTIEKSIFVIKYKYSDEFVSFNPNFVYSVGSLVRKNIIWAKTRSEANESEYS
jgi:hypothetical protein